MFRARTSTWRSFSERITPRTVLIKATAHISVFRSTASVRPMPSGRMRRPTRRWCPSRTTWPSTPIASTRSKNGLEIGQRSEPTRLPLFRFQSVRSNMPEALKLYHAPASPNSRRVRIFLAEKGISLPLVSVELAAGEQHGDAYGAINPRRVVPTLVLEGGTTIGEVPAIWRYLEDTYPATALLGTTQRDKALVTMWERRVEQWRRRRPAGRQSRDTDSPARSGAYAASLRDTNSVKSRTRFVLRVSPCVRSQSVPYMCRSVPGTLTSRGSASPTKHGSVVIPSPCRTAMICASASVVLNGTPVVRTSPSRAQSGIP